MNNLLGIYTIRDTQYPYYWDIVFEWEDAFAQELNLPLIPIGKRFDKIYQPSILKKALNRLNYYQLKDKYTSNNEGYYLAFHMSTPGVYSFHSATNVIPIILDFWKDEDLSRFQNIFSTSRAVILTSMEVYNYLKKIRVKLNLGHISLSLPDKYLQRNIMEKDIDLIQIGRQNDVLNKYVKQFLLEFPEINYVYTEKRGSEVVNVSSRYGVLPGPSDRESFINLLRRSKISLLSAPGLDDDIKRTGGFSPVTPRFLESAACECHMIGIYPDNDDFKYYEISKVCKNVDNYQTFKKSIINILKTNELPNYQSFLNKHLSSVKAKELKNKLMELA